MKKRVKGLSLLLVIVIAFVCSGSVFGEVDSESRSAVESQGETLERLFSNSYQVFKDLRNDLGVYRDSILLEPGENYHPSSVAATGIGLMSLTIGDKKNWEEDALEKAKETVASMTDQTAGFHADRTTNGFYRHFINMENGAQEWDSEYSTVDTAIFLVGALFAEKYFNDEAFSAAVAKLYQSIDFEAAIADSQTGGMYLTMNGDGTGVANSITLPYNEYIIVAWLAYNQQIDNPESKAVKLWQTHYATPQQLLKKPFEGVKLLTDHPDHFISSFTVLFPYYMVNMFSQSEAYQPYIENAYQGDRLWSKLTNKTAPYEWGNGAGASPEGYGYHADAINDNQSLTISPHIISGFLPVNPSGAQDLVDLYTNQKGVYRLQSDTTKEILWRYSVTDPTWRANSIQGIDYSTFLFGLATLDQEIGLSFFQKNNHFFTAVNFDLNGGTSATPPRQQLAVGDEVEAPTPPPSRPGYRFVSWNTQADGSGSDWDFSAKNKPASELTLYAQWQREEGTVVFELNGGTSLVPPVQKLVAGAKLTEPTPTPTRPGYRFIGWNLKVDGSGSAWDFATALMPDGDLTLYAQWQLAHQLLTFDLNGGTSSVPPVQKVAVGELVEEPTPSPTRSGYTFLGWYTKEGTRWDFAKMLMPASETTLYAQWEKGTLDGKESNGGDSTKGEALPSGKKTQLPKTGEKFEFLYLLGGLLITTTIGLYKKL